MRRRPMTLPRVHKLRDDVSLWPLSELFGTG
jgi:hypothetical protein